MYDGEWGFDTSEVDQTIDELPKLTQARIRKNIDKVKTRGLRAGKPLVKHYKGSVWCLRSKLAEAGYFRLFYMQDGKQSFKAIYAFMKKRESISGRHKRGIAAAYKRITATKLK